MDLAQQVSGLIINQLQAKDGPCPYVLSVGLFESLTVQALHKNGKLIFEVDIGNIVIDDAPNRFKKTRVNNVMHYPSPFKLRGEESVLLIITNYIQTLFNKQHTIHRSVISIRENFTVRHPLKVPFFRKTILEKSEIQETAQNLLRLYIDICTCNAHQCS